MSRGGTDDRRAVTLVCRPRRLCRLGGVLRCARPGTVVLAPPGWADAGAGAEGLNASCDAAMSVKGFVVFEGRKTWRRRILLSCV